MNLFSKLVALASCAGVSLVVPALAEDDDTSKLPGMIRSTEPSMITNVLPATPKAALVVFFPPEAPVYGTPVGLPKNVSVTTNYTFEPPYGLGDYVGEPFFPALSTRLSMGPLDTRTADRVAAYMKQRHALTNELQDVLVTLEGVEPLARERELRAFAVVQTPRVAALEAEAAKIAKEIAVGRPLVGKSADWRDHHSWRLGDAKSVPARSAGMAEFQVLRAAGFYEPDLLPEHRGWLEEFTIEERARYLGRISAALAARTSFGSRPDHDVIFFSPEGARLRLPALPPELNTRLADYLRDKALLKDELRAVLVSNDQASDRKRASVLRQLGESQWPRIVALAEQAEGIRRDLAALPPPPPPPLPPQIPLELVARMAAWKKDKAALDRERLAHMNAVSRLPSLSESIARGTMERDFWSFAERRRRVETASEEFLRENADRYAALAAENKNLSAELNQFAQAHLDPATGQPMNLRGLIASISVSEGYFDQIAREEVLYKNYKLAMLEPGLSPEQRRLLFRAARVALSQPLLPGERLAAPPAFMLHL